MLHVASEGEHNGFMEDSFVATPFESKTFAASGRVPPEVPAAQRPSDACRVTERFLESDGPARLAMFSKR